MLTSFIIARFRHLTLIMVTLGFGLLLHEAANSASWLTGGIDGLQGVDIWPLFGLFKFDLYGNTAYGYSLAVLFVVFLVARRLIHSPFGLSLRGIRENARAHAGDRRAEPRAYPHDLHHRRRHRRHRRRAAGADHCSPCARFARASSARPRCWSCWCWAAPAGSMAGWSAPSIFMVARDQFAGINPQYWYFWIGLLLVAVVIFLPNGILGGCRESLRALEAQMSAPALATRGLSKSFGSLVVARDIDLALPGGARYALIGPNGAGKTTLINLITGMLRARRRADFSRRRGHHRARAAAAGEARAGAHLPDQHAVSRPQRAGSGDARGLRTARRGRQSGGAASPRYREAIEEAHDILATLTLGDGCYQRDARTALWPAAAAGDRAGAGDQAEGAAARRAGGRRAAGGKRRHCSRRSRACPTI